MARSWSYFRYGGLCLLAALSLTRLVVGQDTDRVGVPHGILIGHVTDTAGAALADAEVVVARGRDSTTIRSAVTNRFGDVVLRDLPFGDDYALRVRKIGYAPAERSGLALGGDTLVVEVKLAPATRVLPELTATDSALPVVAVVRDGFVFKPLPMFKCFAIGIAIPFFGEMLALVGAHPRRGSAAELGSNSPFDCSERANNKKAARRVHAAVRHVERKTSAGKDPYPFLADTVRWALQICGGEVSDADLLRCREIGKLSPPERLQRAVAALDTMEARRTERLTKEHAADAAKRLLKVVRRAEQARRAGRTFESKPGERLLAISMAQTCLWRANPGDGTFCRALFESFPRSSLDHLTQELFLLDSSAPGDTTRSSAPVVRPESRGAEGPSDATVP